MNYYFAPLEGVTGYAFRRAHARFFTPADKYFAPFISPTQNHRFSPRDLRELCPENNVGVPTVPQLLCRNAEDFIWAADELHAMGYGEVNLNLGCPSGTVSAKGKGAGFLARLEELDHFLDTVYSAVRVPVSIKTRLGIVDPEEFGAILEIYNKYPVAELTIHPRVQKDFYKHPVRMDAFRTGYERAKPPVCYNGDLVRAAQAVEIAEEYPALSALMIGRGLVAKPNLLSPLKDGKPTDKETLRAFHDELYATYSRDFGSPKCAMLRMKELWSYLRHMFADSEAHIKRLNKSKLPEAYEAAVRDIFHDLDLTEY